MFILLVPLAASGQELSTDVYPSEDELLEALIAGDIDYDEYIILLDLIQHGIDSTNLYLLDLIPSLFTAEDTTASVNLESDQLELFASAKSPKRSRIRYSYYRTIDSKEQFRYRVDSRTAISDNWLGKFAVRKDLSGRERFVERALIFRQRHGLVRKFEFGSVIARHGLGSVVGYRGKILDFSDELDGESILFPDNGGFNGIAAEIQPQHWRIKGLASYTRDSAIRLATCAATVERADGQLRPYLTIGANQMRNRSTGNNLDDLKFAAGFSATYHSGNAAVEYCVQPDAGRESQAVIAEGVQKLAGTKLTYAGWMYGDDFVDLSSGSKGADIRTLTDIPELEFEIHSKRPGQRGMQVKAKTALTRDTRLVGAIILARRNADSINVQWLGGLEQDLAQDWSVRVDYLQTDKERDNADSENDRITRRLRAETRLTTDKLKARTYLAFSSTSSYGDYVSLFANAKLKLNDLMRAELWSNLSRISKGTVEYWYLYVRLSQQVLSGCTFSVKLNHRYDRRASINHSNAVLLELEAAW